MSSLVQGVEDLISVLLNLSEQSVSFSAAAKIIRNPSDIYGVIKNVNAKQSASSENYDITLSWMYIFPPFLLRGPSRERA